MSNIHPDRESDVIVRHLKGGPDDHDRWAVFLGSDKRVELPSEQGAMVFARLLADLQQRRVWICDDASGDFSPLDHGHVRGCSCC